MLVRQLVAEDRAAWEALVRDYKRLFHAPADVKACRLTWARLRKAEGCFGIVAVASDGDVVGFAHTVMHDYLWWPPALYLQDLYVREDRRKMGVGGALLAFIQGRAQGDGRRFYWHMEPSAADTVAGLFARFGLQRDSVLFEGAFGEMEG